MLKHKESGERIEFGACFTSDFQGNLGVSLALPTGETNEKGYPERSQIAAVRTVDGKKLDLTNFWINLQVFEDIDAMPPREG